MKVYYQRWIYRDKQKEDRDIGGYSLHTTKRDYRIYVAETAKENWNFYLDGDLEEIELSDEVARFMRLNGCGTRKFYGDLLSSELEGYFSRMLKVRLKETIRAIENDLDDVWEY